MALPRIYQKLFQNEGAGSVLRSDILPPAQSVAVADVAINNYNTAGEYIITGNKLASDGYPYDTSDPVFLKVIAAGDSTIKCLIHNDDIRIGYTDSTGAWSGWQEVGTNYDSQIAALESNVSTNTSNLSTLATRVSTAEGGIATNTSDLTALTTRITTAEGDIDSLEERMTTAEGSISTINNNLSGMLDASGKLKQSAMPDVLQHNKGIFAAASEMPTTDVQAGDYCINTETDTVWIYDADTSAWVDSDRKGQVTSVNGQTGEVVLDINSFVTDWGTME